MKQFLQKTPLETGNRIAWWVLIGCVGFIVGWVMNGERLYTYCLGF